MRTRFLSAMAACAAAVVVAGTASGPAGAAVVPLGAVHATHHGGHAPAPRSRLLLAPRHSRTGQAQAGRTGRHLLASRVSPASAQLPAVVSQSPVGWTPNVFAGASQCNTQWFGANCAPSTVYSMAVVNGEVVVAGAFTQACVPGPAASGNCSGGKVTRNDIFAYSLSTGAIDPNFAPVLDQGPVFSVVAGPGNTVYAGGNFTTVNGASHAGVVQLSLASGSDGQVVSGFNGQINGAVNALAYNGNALYVGGQFNHADGSPAAGLVRLSATTGALDSSFAFTLTGGIPLTALFVQTLALSPDGNHLAIGGTFLSINGQSRPRLALISTGGGFGATASLANWAAPWTANNCSKEHAYINGLDFSPDGTYFAVVTTGYMSSPTGPSICDAAARFETGASGTNVHPVWVNYSGGDTLHSVAIAGSVVYVGGHNRWITNECGNNTVCEANATMVGGISALDANTGLALPWWHPGTLRGVGVQALTVLPPGEPGPAGAGGLLLGTDVNTIAGVFHGENALFPLTTTSAQTPGGPIMSGMFSDGRPGGAVSTTKGPPAVCLDAANDGSANGTKVQLWTCLNDASQNWTIQPDGTIRINGACLTPQGTGSILPNGAKLQLWHCFGGASQKWHQPTGGNTLVNGAGGRCMDDPNSSTTKGTQLQIWSCNGGQQQTWPLPVAQAPPPPPATGPVYSVLRQADTQVPCLQDPGGSGASGTAVQLWTCFQNTTQSWTPQSNGTIKNNGLCLDTSGGRTANGTQVVLDTCSGAASQVWTPTVNHALVNKASGTCLDDPNSNTVNGATIQIWSCSGGLNQQWRMPAV